MFDKLPEFGFIVVFVCPLIYILLMVITGEFERRT